MRILIADDHTLFRDALVQYIERSNPDAVVSLAKDFHQAFDSMEKNPYQDLVILDLRMPGMHGLDGLKQMKEKFPHQAVALMSGVAEQEDVQKAFDLGAIGYFPKTMSGKALLQAIKQTVEGRTYIPEDKNGATRYMPSYYDDGDSAVRRQQEDISNDLNLTPRENEVLTYLVDGVSNKEIARALNLQVVTVKLHVRGICRKLNAQNRTQAALKAKEMGVSPASSGIQ